MKKLAMAAAFSLAATSAFGGGLSDPIVEDPIINETSSSAGGIFIPLLFLVLAAAAASSYLVYL